MQKMSANNELNEDSSADISPFSPLAIPQMWTPLKTRVKRLSAADTRSVSPRVTRELCASTARSSSTGECEGRRHELSKDSQ